ncbi:hypothetical protein KUCAC02_009982, partial [Chaenocephalus aceratus]
LGLPIQEQKGHLVFVLGQFTGCTVLMSVSAIMPGKKTWGEASPSPIFLFITDDLCVWQAPGRPNPLPVYYASETAEAIHTRSPLGNKRRKSS